MTDSKRRRLLQGALLAGGAALLPWRRAAAQGALSDGLLRAPRRALVIGNSAYGFAPLRNPENDARAIAEALRATGFEVALALDASRAQMLQSIEAYGALLAQSKAVGLFYFAGHGVQLAWRNYLLPTDARIERMEDVRERCVDMNAVIEGMARAANPMNIVILDACRENPFGRDFRVEQPGLSQLDAPPGSLLAYATSPGNVASDGAGAHGLYTEHLLREVRVPEAKIEDVFKRVRLAVRRGSRGAQIPWESTSLEQDFWFIPPVGAGEPSEEAAAQEYLRELALWDRAQDSAEAGALEDYLKRYPSGRFAELAQLRLDRLLAAAGEQRVEVVSSPQNPYSQGFARADTRFRLGDRYVYDLVDRRTGQRKRSGPQTVISISDEEVVYSNGLITDLLGNTRRNRNGRRVSQIQLYPTEFVVGKRWTTRFTVTNPRGIELESELTLRIAAREQVTVPAGTFECFRLEGSGYAAGPRTDVAARVRMWCAPELVRRPIASEERRVTIPSVRRRGQRVLVDLRRELVAFSQG